MQPDHLVIWRDSVAAGDDADAPHEWRLAARADTSVAAVADRVRDAHYLASIIGGQATWILEGASPLAVLAQQWEVPRYLTSPDAPVWDMVRRDGQPHLLVRYWCQVDPARVYECLQAGQPLPDRYGR